jgi:hypothetical protein
MISFNSKGWHSGVTLFPLLSHIELCAIATSANQPSLAGQWPRWRQITTTVGGAALTQAAAEKAAKARSGGG